MSSMPSDAVAFRREFAIGIAVFVASFFGIAGLILYLHIRYVIPETGKWGIVLCIRYLLEFPLFGAGLSVIAVVFLIRRWHYWRGLYHCNFCGNTIRRKSFCPCRRDSDRTVPPQPSMWARTRKYILPVLMIHIALVPIAMELLRLTRHPRPYPLIQDIATAHALLCTAIVVAIKLLMDITELSTRGRRLRERLRPYVALIVLWPIAFAFGMALHLYLAGK